LPSFDPDVEWSEPPESPGAAVYRGRDGVRRSFEKWVGAWEDYRLDVEELIDVGDHVFARCSQRVRGRTSGIDVEQRLFSVWTLLDGKVVRMRMYYDEREALEAAGLRR
jgi:ketosteroid isomerase-like protein